MTGKVLTEDVLTWYATEVDPWGQAEDLLVETASGYLVIHADDPWPLDTIRWAALPRRLTTLGWQ